MKKIFFMVALCAPVWACGQTVELEEAYVNKCISEKTWTQIESTDRGKQWKALRAVYPKIPYDTATKMVTVEHIVTFPGVAQAQAFKRVKEWGALHFGSLDAVTDYEDAESGKIIMEGFVPVTYEATFENMWGTTKSVPTFKSLYFSLVVTVKDGKAKVRYENLKYHYTVGGYMAGSVYVPVEVVRLPFGVGFPITAGAPGTWKGAVELLNKTMSELNATAPSLEKYVREVTADYGF